MKECKKICVEAQSFFATYMKTGELPMDILSHLESCLDCLLVFNRDLNLRKRLKEAVKKTQVPPALEVSVREFIKNGKSSAQFAGRID